MTRSGKSTQCSQCGKPAIVTANQQPLCVEHYTALTNVENERIAAANKQMELLQRESDYLAQGIHYTFGLRPTPPQYNFPQPIVHNNPMTFHNLKIDSSAIGILNLGKTQSIDLAVGTIRSGGDKEIADALQSITELVAKHTDVDEATKKELLSLIEILSQQAVLSSQQRSDITIKSILSSKRRSGNNCSS